MKAREKAESAALVVRPTPGGPTPQAEAVSQPVQQLLQVQPVAGEVGTVQSPPLVRVLGPVRRPPVLVQAPPQDMAPRSQGMLPRQPAQPVARAPQRMVVQVPRGMVMPPGFTGVDMVAACNQLLGIFHACAQPRGAQPPTEDPAR